MILYPLLSPKPLECDGLTSAGEREGCLKLKKMENIGLNSGALETAAQQRGLSPDQHFV
jgi:hypothetical protein